MMENVPYQKLGNPKNHNESRDEESLEWTRARARASGLHDISRRINSTCLQPNEIVLCIMSAAKRPRFRERELALL